MRLCEMSTEQMADTLCAIAEPIGRIAQDEKFCEFLKQMNGKKPLIQTICDAVTGAVPSLLGERRGDLYTVIAAFTDKSINEIKAQKAFQTIRDIRGFLDDDLTSFFTSCAGTVPNP